MDISKNREEKLLQIYNDFDFGYDVAVITSKEWLQSNQDEYIKYVYLEFIDTSSSQSHESHLKVKFQKDSCQPEHVICSLVGTNLNIGSLTKELKS